MFEKVNIGIYTGAPLPLQKKTKQKHIIIQPP